MLGFWIKKKEKQKRNMDDSQTRILCILAETASLSGLAIITVVSHESSALHSERGIIHVVCQALFPSYSRDTLREAAKHEIKTREHKINGADMAGKKRKENNLISRWRGIED